MALLEDFSGSQESIAKRDKPAGPGSPLTKENPERLEKRTPQSGLPNQSSISTPSKFILTPAKQSCPMDSKEVSSGPSLPARAFSANNPGFQKALKDLNVKPPRIDKEPDADDVKKLLNIMEQKRESPPPDNAAFSRTLDSAESANETAVFTNLTPLLMPRLDLVRDNDKTKNLEYRYNVGWQGWGSAKPGVLPTPKPDIAITFKESTFTLDQQSHMVSPYSDEAAFYPTLICEVKTALQGNKIADRQNANNALRALIADFEFQCKIGQDREKEGKIRLITTAHNTRSQWYTVWFYVFGANGSPEWCFKPIREVDFWISNDGFERVRQYNLNIQEEFINSHMLSQLKADLVKASQPGLQDMSGFGPENQINTPPLMEPDTPSATSEIQGQTFEAHPLTYPKRAKGRTDGTLTEIDSNGTQPGRRYLNSG